MAIVKVKMAAFTETSSPANDKPRVWQLLWITAIVVSISNFVPFVHVKIKYFKQRRFHVEHDSVSFNSNKFKF